MLVAHIHKGRFLGAAALVGVFAAGAEVTAPGRMDGAGQVPFQQDALPGRSTVGLGMGAAEMSAWV